MWWKAIQLKREKEQLNKDSVRQDRDRGGERWSVVGVC